MRNSPLASLNLPERSAVVQAMFMHAVESLHADLSAASERGALPSRVSVRSLLPLPGTASFVVDVRPEPSSASFRPIRIDRVLVRMTDQTVGNRVVDGVNAHMRQLVVCPNPTSFSLIDFDFTAKAETGPMQPCTITCGVQNALNVPLKSISKVPSSLLANIFRNDFRKFSAPNCSAKMT